MFFFFSTHFIDMYGESYGPWGSVTKNIFLYLSVLMHLSYIYVYIYTYIYISDDYLQSPKSKMLFNCGIEHSPSRFSRLSYHRLHPGPEGASGQRRIVAVGDGSRRSSTRHPGCSGPSSW